MGSLASVYDYDDGKNIYWDAQGHLDYVYLNDGTVLNYNFNASGQLESKWVDGESLSLYKFEGDRLISQTVNGVNFLIFLYDESGNVDAIKYKGEKYYLVRNIQGDVVELRDKTGSLVAKYTYNAYGYLLSVRDQYTSEITDMTHIAHINPIRYRGYYYDTDLKWYYLNSRYYSPELGRFVSADNQISGVGENPLGYNMFAYCFNDPVNRVDPTGDWPKWLETTVKVVSVVVAVAAAVATVAAVSAFTAGTGSAAAVYGTSIALGAALSGINGGVANEAKGNSYANGWLGGAVGGAIQATCSRTTTGTILGGGVGVTLGTAVTDVMNNVDQYSSDSTPQEIVQNAVTSGGKALVTSTVTALVGAGVGGIDYKTNQLYGGVADGCDGLMPSLTLGLGTAINTFFGWIDDATVYIWE